MFLNKTEESLMLALLERYKQYPNESYIFVWENGLNIKAKINCFYETDNGYEMNDSKYLEYYACAIQIINIISMPNSLTYKQFKEENLYEISGLNIPSLIKIVDSIIIWKQ